MKTIALITALILTGCESFTVVGNYGEYSIDRNRNITAKIYDYAK